ncbi:hypothetical protein [Microvirga aerophila]|nr:hypothetical protein [Microvirga aerophila]
MTLIHTLVRQLRRSLLISLPIGTAKLLPLVEIGLRSMDYA